MSNSLALVICILISEALHIREVSCCFVTPSAAAVIVGDMVSLTCTAGDGAAVDSWLLGNVIVYQSVLIVNGHSQRSRNVSVGYSVNDTNAEEVMLTLNNAMSAQAGYYYCACINYKVTPSDRVTSAAYVSVIVSGPSFAAVPNFINGGPVIFVCQISYVGQANVSFTIMDKSRNILNQTHEFADFQGVHNSSLSYNATANATSIQMYFCNVTMENDTSVLFSEYLNASVQWSAVKNVKMFGEDPSVCINGSFCAVNQTVFCSAEGNPQPDSYQWVITVNGSRLNESENNSNQNRLMFLGLYQINCTASNYFLDTRYNASGYFTTEVNVDGPPTTVPYSQVFSAPYSRLGLILGLILGMLFLIAIIIVAILIWKRIKRRTVFCNHEEQKISEKNQAVEAKELSKHKETNGTTDGNLTKSVDQSTKERINHGYETNGSDETTLVENDLYSSKKNNAVHIESPDGGYASLNEINSKQ